MHSRQHFYQRRLRAPSILLGSSCLFSGNIKTWHISNSTQRFRKTQLNINRLHDSLSTCKQQDSATAKKWIFKKRRATCRCDEHIMFPTGVQEWSATISIMGIYFKNQTKVQSVTLSTPTHSSRTKILVEKGRKIRDIHFMKRPDTSGKLAPATESLSFHRIYRLFISGVLHGNLQLPGNRSFSLAYW